jgi:GT2 family glycosyltransferase
MINICVPVLRRYDLLEKLVKSVNNSTVSANIFIVNNGKEKVNISGDNIKIFTFGLNVGVASSWNFFLRNVPEIRLITNDDIEFYPDALQKLIENYNENNLIVPNLGDTNIFSCFIMSNKVVEKVGYFDETISPNYGYFEDNDFSHRMSKEGIGLTIVNDARVNHLQSGTLKSLNGEEKQLHHQKFRFARSNYIKKWGGLPGKETR